MLGCFLFDNEAVHKWEITKEVGNNELNILVIPKLIKKIIEAVVIFSTLTTKVLHWHLLTLAMHKARP